MTRLPFNTSRQWTPTARAIVMNPENDGLDRQLIVTVAESLARSAYYPNVPADIVKRAIQVVTLHAATKKRIPVGTHVRLSAAAPPSTALPAVGVVRTIVVAGGEVAVYIEAPGRPHVAAAPYAYERVEVATDGE